MILVINMNPAARERRGTRRIVRALQRLAPETPVRERHFARLDDAGIAAARAVVLGPQGVPFDAYPSAARERMFAMIRGLTAPTLGICGGHQAMALAYGGTLAPVHGGAASGSYDGHRKETGRRTVRVATPDPLLGAAGRIVEVEVSHVEGVSRIPAGFECVGVGDPCAIQAMRRVGTLQWGVQFHPELGGDGASVLRGFLEASGILPVL